jgi:hypothetical protein
MRWKHDGAMGCGTICGTGERGFRSTAVEAWRTVPLPRMWNAPLGPIRYSRRRACFPRQAGRCSRRQKCSSSSESGSRTSLLDPAGCSRLNGLSAGGVRLLPLRGSSSGSTAAQRSSYGPVGAERIQRTVLWARCQIWALRAAELGQLGPGRRSRASQVGRSRKPRPRSRRQGGLGWPRTPRTPRRSACAGRFRSRGDGVVDEDCCDGGGGGEG